MLYPGRYILIESVRASVVQVNEASDDLSLLGVLWVTQFFFIAASVLPEITEQIKTNI